MLHACYVICNINALKAKNLKGDCTNMQKYVFGNIFDGTIKMKGKYTVNPR